MVRTARPLALALALAALVAGAVRGQTAVATPEVAPAPVSFGTPVPADTAPPPQAPPGPSTGLPYCNPYQDNNGPLLVGDPLLDGPRGTAALGWVGSIGADLVKPVVHSRMAVNVILGRTVQNHVPDPTFDTGTIVPVSVPFAHQPWTVMPRAELGYRFGQGAGEFLVGYRLLAVAGSDAGGGGALHSRANLHFIDLDYANHENSLGPLWDMKWRAGVRIANAYTDSRAVSALVAERAAEAFTGAGPHLGLDVRRRLGVQGLSLFGRLDNSFPIGQLTQLYEETLAGVGGTTRLRSPTPIVTLGVQAGLNYCVTDNLSVTGGYTYEHIWDLMTYYTSIRSESIGLQGAFLRAEWKY